MKVTNLQILIQKARLVVSQMVCCMSIVIVPRVQIRISAARLVKEIRYVKVMEAKVCHSTGLPMTITVRLQQLVDALHPTTVQNIKLVLMMTLILM